MHKGETVTPRSRDMMWFCVAAGNLLLLAASVFHEHIRQAVVQRLSVCVFLVVILLSLTLLLYSVATSVKQWRTKRELELANVGMTWNLLVVSAGLGLPRLLWQGESPTWFLLLLTVCILIGFGLFMTFRMWKRKKETNRRDGQVSVPGNLPL